MTGMRRCLLPRTAFPSRACTRRRHVRSSQILDGHDWNHYTPTLLAHRRRISTINTPYMSCHSTAGSRSRAGLSPSMAESRVQTADAHISAVAPLMVTECGQSGGLPNGGVRRLAGAGRRQPRASLLRFAGRTVSRLLHRPARSRRQAPSRNMVAPGHDGRPTKAHYDCSFAFSQPLPHT